MAACKDNKNPLQHNGTAQSDRMLPAMRNDYVQLDERGFAEWIVFAREYTAMLHFFEPANEKSGDWSVFFSSDTTAVFGTIALQDVQAYKSLVKGNVDYLKDENNALPLVDAKMALHQLFSIAFSFAACVDYYCRLMPQGHSYALTIANLVKGQLSPAIHRILSYYKPCMLPQGMPDKDLLAPSDVSSLKVLGQPVKTAEDIYAAGLSQLWWKGNANWEAYVDSVVADPSIYGTHADAFRQLNYAANHNLFTGAFDTLLMGFSRLVAAAEKELQIALTQRNTHPPHYALFLAFLRLYRAAQDEMNKLGRKHLDFYYKDILQLKTRPSQPNFVHIVTSLSKTTENLILAKDVLYKAGKDSIGKDVSYGLDEETTFNKATVADLRAVYIGEAGDDDLGSKNNGRVFAAPVINSADGLGSGLKSSGKEWHPMANRLYIEGDVASVEMPFAEIGFAVASHYFFMAEGERSIRLRFETSDNQLISGKAFRVFLTTEKDWYEVPEDIYPAEGEFRQGGVACIEFNISLTGDAPSVTDYNPEVHKGNLEVQVPVLKVLLKHDVDAYYDYGVLRDVSVKKMEILVSAGGLSSYNQNGLKNLILSADSGPIDGSKAFQPFGPSPVAGNRLVIGSKELLSKKNVTIGFNIEYKDINSYSSTSIAYGTQPDGGNLPNMAIKFLKRGKWEIWESKRELFSTSINETILIKPSSKLDDLVVVDYNDPDYSFGPHVKNGFICFELLEIFGHKAYQQALTEYLIDQSKESPKLSKPEEPYTPVIKSLYVSYEAHSEVIDLGSEIKSLFQAKSFSFIHLYPFGSLEQHTLVTGEQVHYFLPQFRQYDEVLGADRKHQGEFYIGFAGLKPQSAVQVLFQVMDGTADPTLTIPDDHVRWSYLSGNAWVDFSKQDIIDRTRQLIQSGTIRFSIPEDATTEHSLMPSDLIWIRASVEDKVDGICKLIDVKAQAAVVSFRDNNNAPDFLEKALPKETISKLKVPESAVKKIEQPFASFGGRPAEKEDSFYVRVSERLRHKSRAITIWDYEHLVLEEFPLIHKVKCLNHTRSSDEGYNEVLPGHVTIITIPDLQQRNDINPLKPYTSQDVLAQIKDFLKARISCHVKLHVVNPDFEEVQLKFRLKLAKGYDDFSLYANLLKQEITDFLSPWATGKGDISFGGLIHKSVVIDFIEERPYVDFITDVEMAHYDAARVLVSADNDSVRALFSKSILVSVPASKHEIEEIVLPEAGAVSDCPKTPGKKITNKKRQIRKDV